MSTRDTPVPMSELEAIWKDQRARGICYNGCTQTALTERYGDRVYHVAGEGWYVRAAPAEARPRDE